MVSNYLTETKIYSGIRKNQLLGNRMVFVTLTSSNEARYSCLNDDFQILKKRIVRKYLKDDPTSLQYCKIETDEGNGVLHMVLKFKPYLPHQWLRSQWYDIHKGSDQIYIEEVDDAYGVSQYIVSHYLGSQKCSYSRYSASRDWIASGYSMVYRYLRKSLRDRSELITTPYGTSYYPVDWDALTSAWGCYIDELALDHPPTAEQFLVSFETRLNPEYEGLDFQQITGRKRAYEHNKWVDEHKSRWACEPTLFVGSYHLADDHPLQASRDPDFDKKYFPKSWNKVVIISQRG